jgi:glycosyltransferase involved in cell wall biosynthesis
MRLLMLNNEFPPLGGGTGTVNRALLHEFSQRPDIEIDLVTAALGCRPEQEQFASRIRIFKVPVRNKNIHHSSNRELIEYFFRATYLAFKLQRQECYDLCFAWSTLPAGAIAWLLRRIRGVVYIVRVCGPDIPGFEIRYARIYRVLSPVIRAVWRDAAIVIAKSKGEVAMISAIDQKVKTLIIPNGVNLVTFSPKEIGEDEGSLRVLCVGRLIERKGQCFLINAVRTLRDAGVKTILDLVGTGDSRADLEQQAERLGLRDVVNFHGYVPREDIPRYYNQAHVFVLPSYNEGMSVALLEAMAAGLPVVTTPTPGVVELVLPEVNGLIFDWADVKQLSAHLHRLAMNRSELRKMGQASRRRVVECSWEQVRESYYACLCNVVKNGGVKNPEIKSQLDT